MRILGVKSSKVVVFVATCLFFIFLVGCGLKKYEKTTLEFRKDGNFALHIVDALDETIYNYEELKALNEAEVNVYNSYGKGKVTIENSSFADGIVRIDLCYDSVDAYYDMNNLKLFYGSAFDAKNAGYNLVDKVTSTMGDGILSKEAWDAMSAQLVVVVSEEIDINMPGKILYAGEGVTLTGANKAAASGEGLKYIICE